MEKYYIVVDGEKKGPYALSQLREMWKTGALTMDTKYATEGMDGWADVGDLMEVGSRKDIITEPTPLSPTESAKKELESNFIKKSIVKLDHAELKDCPACGEATSRDATTCPACGCNFYQRLIRIFLTFILAPIFCVLALGVGLVELVVYGNRLPMYLVFMILVNGGLFCGLYWGDKLFYQNTKPHIAYCKIVAFISLGIIFNAVLLCWLIRE